VRFDSSGVHVPNEKRWGTEEMRMEMNATTVTRATAYVRKLHVGDTFIDDYGKWLVTREPIEIAYGRWAIWLRPVPRNGSRSRVFEYGEFDRVKLA
jgi:hypothetical protein